ncbi:rhomboid family intramembrane serine protease [Rhodovibrionaceae bacterium A322]
MSFLPLYDNNPRRLIARPWVTWGLILLNILIFGVSVSEGQRGFLETVFGWGFIPAVFSGQDQLASDLYQVPSFLTLFSSQFLHGGFLHLAGNMLFLWVFGDNIEDAMGHKRFLVFYLLCGLAAGLIHFAADPGSRIPTVGASGAISGVLGAYLLLHPRAKVLVPIFFIPLFVPAFVLLIFWFAMQVLSAAGSSADMAGVAWWAHIGGFLVGMGLVVPFRYKTVPLFDGRRPPRGIRLNRKPKSKS